MTISLPKPLRKFVLHRVDAGGFGSVSDYVRELIRRDQHDQQRAAFERTLVAASAGLDKLSSIPPEVWRELRGSLIRGESQIAAAKFSECEGLLNSAVLLTRERLRRELPDAPAAEIERRLAQWLHDRGADDRGDGPGRPISSERLKRIRGD